MYNILPEASAEYAEDKTLGITQRYRLKRQFFKLA